MSRNICFQHIIPCIPPSFPLSLQRIVVLSRCLSWFRSGTGICFSLQPWDKKHLSVMRTEALSPLLSPSSWGILPRYFQRRRRRIACFQSSLWERHLPGSPEDPIHLWADWLCQLLSEKRTNPSSLGKKLSISDAKIPSSPSFRVQVWTELANKKTLKWHFPAYSCPHWLLHYTDCTTDWLLIAPVSPLELNWWCSPW